MVGSLKHCKQSQHRGASQSGAARPCFINGAFKGVYCTNNISEQVKAYNWSVSTSRLLPRQVLHTGIK